MANDLKSMLAQQDKGLLIPLVDSHLISEGTKVMSLSKGAILS